MRLIDADELLKHFRYGGRDTEYDKAWISTVRRIIKEQPTAYDINKVIDNLREPAEYINGKYYITVENAIAIVKEGGIDE
jgi:fructose/tagatose bisphosphate aldolase